MTKLNHTDYITIFLIIILIALISYYNIPIGIALLIIYSGYLFYQFQLKKDKKEDVIEGLDKIYNEFDELNRLRMNQLPVAYVIVDEEGNIIWFNDAFFEAFYKNENKTDIDIKGRNIENELNLNLEECLKKDTLEYSYQKIDYDVVTQNISDSRGNLHIINFFDVTLLKRQKEIYKRYEPLFCYIIIDNFDEMIDPLPAFEKASILSQIDLHLNEWADRKDAFIIHLENDRYLVIFEREKLEVMVDAHFRILDEIRDIQTELNTKVPLSLSIGVGVSNKPKTIKEADEMSHLALEMAQARGGDQAVVKIDDEINYYGGRNEAAVHHNKVKARVKAQALKEIMKEADNILIVGHRNPDMDCLGAGMGLIDAARDLNKNAKFILNNNNYGIYNFIDLVNKSEKYRNSIIRPEEAENFIRKNSLLIIVDTQNANYLDFEPILNQIENKVIIDHHRRSENEISPTLLNYTEVYSSSTCELVTELLSYFDSKSVLTPFGATALMSGICMDTKMFLNRTGVRTFEAASYLKRRGADMNQAKSILQDDFKTYSRRMKAIQDAEILYNGTIALSMYQDDSEYAKIIASQAADEMLNIKNIKASFVILKSQNEISISGRSRKDINVQIILENLGGGGHFNMAGAQLKETNDLIESKDILLNQINKYFIERDSEIEDNIA